MTEDQRAQIEQLQFETQLIEQETRKIKAERERREALKALNAWSRSLNDAIDLILPAALMVLLFIIVVCVIFLIAWLRT
jgi:hypothetical protein